MAHVYKLWPYAVCQSYFSSDTYTHILHRNVLNMIYDYFVPPYKNNCRNFDTSNAYILSGGMYI